MGIRGFNGMCCAVSLESCWMTTRGIAGVTQVSHAILFWARSRADCFNSLKCACMLLAAFQREFARQHKKNKKVTKEIDFIWRTVE